MLGSERGVVKAAGGRAGRRPERHALVVLLQRPSGICYRFVDGRIVEWDVTSRRHGLSESELTRVVGNFVREHHLGSIASGEVLVRIPGSRHDARGSDIEFTRRGRLSQGDLDAPAA